MATTSLYYSNFADGTLGTYEWNTTGDTCITPATYGTIATPSGQTGNWLRIEQPSSLSSCYDENEPMRLFYVPSPYVTVTLGQEYWVGARIYVDSWNPLNTNPRGFSISWLAEGSVTGEPSLLIGNGVIALWRRWQDGGLQESKIGEVALSTGQYYDVVYRVVRALDATGLLEGWIKIGDGEYTYLGIESNVITAVANTARFRFGAYARYTSSATVLPRILYYTNVSVRQGTDGFADVDPSQTSGDNPGAVPDGYTAVDDEDASFTGTWTRSTYDPDSLLLGGSERYWTPGAGAATADYSFGDGNTSAGTLKLAYYVWNKADRSASVSYKVYENDNGGGDSEIGGGVIDETLNLTEQQWVFLPDCEYSAGTDVELSLQVQVAGTETDWIAVDQFAYKQTTATAGDGIAVIDGVQVEVQPTASTSISITNPDQNTLAAAGDLYVVVLFINNDVTISTVNNSLVKFCSELETSTDTDRCLVAFYKWWDDSETGTFDITWSTTSSAIGAAFLLRNVNQSTMMDVTLPSHATGTASAYHLNHLDCGEDVTPATVTTNSSDACVLLISANTEANSTLTDIYSDNGSATELVNQIYDVADAHEDEYGLFVTMQNIAAASTEVSDTHTFEGAATGANVADGLSLAIALKKAPGASPELTVVNPSLWSTPPANAAKNSDPVEYDPIGDSEVSGGTGPYSIVGASGITGCVAQITSNVTNDTLTLTPEANFDGTAEFSVTFGDSANASETVQGSFTVTNQSPTGANGSITVEAGETRYFNLLTVGSYADADSDSGTAELVTSAPGGTDPCTLTMESDNITLKVVAGDTIETQSSATYRFNDGSSTSPYSPEYTLTINVVAPPVIPVDPPVLPTDSDTRTAVGTKSFQFKIDLTKQADGTAYSTIFDAEPTNFSAAVLTQAATTDSNEELDFIVDTSPIHTFTVDGNSPSSGIAEGTLGQLLFTAASSYRGMIYLATYAGNDAEGEWIQRVLNIVDPVSTSSSPAGIADIAHRVLE